MKTTAETTAAAAAGTAELFNRTLGLLRRVGRKLGPYVLLELLMPGGTMLALLLFVYRRGLQNPA